MYFSINYEMNDRGKLVQFIDDFKEFLEELLKSRANPVPRELYKELIDAWLSVLPRFTYLKAGISEVNDEKLWTHGLLKEELIFKLKAIQYHYQRYRGEKGIRSPLFGIFLGIGGGKRGLKRLLDGIDKLLESIFAATGVEGAIGEFKGVIETFSR